MNLLLFILLAVTPTCHYARHGAVLLPDPHCTPGATLPVASKDICAAGYAQRVRNVSGAVKTRVYREYAAAEARGACCEVDHLISLELGGSNDPPNLWPQPYGPQPGAHEKDKLEDRLHEEVCAGRLPLAQAQRMIRRDWYAAYEKYFGGK